MAPPPSGRNDSANTIRLKSTTYPNGRVIENDYGTAGEMNDILSRVAEIVDVSTDDILARYVYLGLSTVVIAGYGEDGTDPSIELTYLKQGGESNGDAGDQYAGLDRFGRVVDQRWLEYSTGAR
jgi:hypothetical protein